MRSSVMILRIKNINMKVLFQNIINIGKKEKILVLIYRMKRADFIFRQILKNMQDIIEILKNHMYH